jgi:23S rRNA (guanine745-N1)-methyltransferase
MTVPYRCPNCTQVLASDASGWGCGSGHRFDRAKEGYVNLLPAGRKKGGDAGDSAEMLAARRRFFDRGHYAPVMAAVAAMVPSTATTVLDAGCGEGSYLAAVSAVASRFARNGALERHGIDIAKPGIRMAARRHHDMSFAVASAYRLPFPDASFDAVLSVFAPRPFEEFSRVLRDGGVTVVASPGAAHLASLRQLLYDEQRVEHDDVPHGATEAERVNYELTLDGDDLRSLLHMTPHWWRASPARRNEVLALAQLTTTVDIWVTRHPTTAG